jgi:vacuolar-type H+-ATPase subunit E/Vma4
MTGEQPLLDEVMAEAERQATALIERARQERERIRAEAEREAAALADKERERGRAEAERRHAQILATVPVQQRRLAELRSEGLLDEIARQARQRLSALDEVACTEATARLAAHAIQRLAADSFVVKLARAMEGTKLRDAIAALSGQPPSTIEVVAAPELDGPGPRVEGADGRLIWDNRLLERLGRLWPALRTQVAARLPASPGRKEAA